MSSVWRGEGVEDGGITKEKVICVWTIAANFENLNQVEELSVYVSHYRYRRLDVDHIAFLHQQLFGFRAYCFDD